ncbi:GNAT family N-acetyltransferase [Azospirillum sp. ST 5-10]|uniref:GNAT family N-acetyltransferase n=1 Tax=unclassified Azospirillum TaxID=2630922 RepID=UPI003F49DCF2
MEPTDAAPPAVLDAGRRAGCLALSAEAGWNQTAADWDLFLGHGTVFGLCDGVGGPPVATGAVLPYDGGFAWIGMVLVTAARRRARLGTRILETCLAALAERALVPLLDATPAGEAVYRPLGFAPLFGLARWQGPGGAGQGRPPAAGVRALATADLPAAVAADAAAFGASRRFLLEDVHRRAPGCAFVTADGSGFVLARPGRTATQIGPLVAADPASAAALLDAALDAAAGPVLLDLADGWGALGRRLEARGFTVQRPFLRMARGRSAPFGDPRRLVLAAGPEFG